MIAHLAIWTQDLERMRTFYETYFGAKSSAIYQNTTKQFTSYFLSFGEGCQLELMHRPDVPSDSADPFIQRSGLIHFAVSVGSHRQVDALTNRLKADGYEIADGPRTTGDGYYESVVLDPEKNRIEITI
ncbi:VOC family protein [Larkinella rosea]|uniref:Glyoxalase n=1 Tax=Larkinella rosea TaxID=2025312 RepID=A0A3P1C3T4_9BACT|nr:VOC family protein [Larkinella rosea]RRB07434.1 glyoxalase [Larkinella rosea]